jgi:anhydro-N-acetylmuramic acid kinase
MRELYIGLMSGTSLDGIDAALVDFNGNKACLVETEYFPLPVDLQNTLQRLCKPDALISLKEYGTMDSRLGLIFADIVNSLLVKANYANSSIFAVGSHGLTLYHAPCIGQSGMTEASHTTSGQYNQFPFSLQLGDPNIIAEKTGITTVADFRRRDIAAKGQGAPLVPAFHHAAFHHPEENRCIINIGGIANITVLPKHLSEKVTGFDTGPGNILMDLWIKLH